MLEEPSTYRSRRRRPPKRRSGLRIVLGIALVAIAFAVGIALGRALEEGPEPGGTVTYVRTLEPLPQQPVTTGP
jgi:hypothetical protein